MEKLLEEVIIQSDKKFQDNKKVHTNTLGITKKDNLIITVSNLHDTGITIKQNQLAATAAKIDPGTHQYMNKHTRKNANSSSKGKESLQILKNQEQEEAEIIHFQVPQKKEENISKKS